MAAGSVLACSIGTRRRTFTYKRSGELSLKADLYSARSGTRNAAVVFIHGGGLMYGSRDIAGTQALAALRGAGFTIVSIDYRLAPESKLPEILEDISDAIAWVRANNELLKIDPTRVAVFGASAGAYLALLSGVLLQPKPSAIVSCWGYGDISGRAHPEPGYRREQRVSREQALAAVGSTPIAEVPRNHKRQSFYIYCRQRGLWTAAVAGTGHPDTKRFSVLDQIDGDYPPTLLLHGTADEDVPLAESQRVVSRLAAAGVEHDLVIIPGASHGISNLSPPDRLKIYARAAGFLRKHL